MRTGPAPYGYRNDPSVPPFPDDQPIIVFDGECEFCSGWVRFALRHDKSGHYRFLPAQSPLGAALYVHYGLDPTDYETNIFICGGQAFFKAEGSMRMIAGLGFPWSLVNLARVIPRPLLDKVYQVVAVNRFRWFGRRESCFVPDEGTRARFLA